MKLRTVIWVLGVTLLALLGYGVYRAGFGETPPPPVSSDIVFKHGVANGERIKTRSWSADYDRLVSNPDQTILTLQNVRNGTIFKHGKPYLRVRAHQLTVNTVSRDFSASGGLHVETVGSIPRRSFDTESAQWTDAVQTLVMTHSVTIRTGAQAPLVVGSLSFDVKTGQVDLTAIDGPVRFK